MKRQELEQWLINHNYTKDNYGHYHLFLSDGKEYRFKMQKTSCRYEVAGYHAATQYSPKAKFYVRLKSGYYKQMSVNEEGKLSGLKR